MMTSAAQQDHDEPDRGDEASEATSPTDGIGRRLSLLRKQRGMRVTDIARMAGVTPSLISQIERGQSGPSVTTLFALAEALNVPVDALFDRRPRPDAWAPAPGAPLHTSAEPRASADGDGDGRHYLVRAGERAAVDIEGGVRWERLTPQTLDSVEFLEIVYQPFAQSNENLYRHPGSEMVLLLSGQLHIHVGFQTYELVPGDSIQFPSSMPHRYVNPADEIARAVTVILHDHVSPTSHEVQRRP